MSILCIKDPADLDRLLLEDTKIGQPEFEHIMRLLGLMWLYEGSPSPSRPHALLVSGKHSNGYLDVGSLVKEHEMVRWILAKSISDEIRRVMMAPIAGVFGADTSSTALAGDVAQMLGARHLVLRKEGDQQIWVPDQENLVTGQRVVQVEELMTTASSAEKAVNAIVAGNPGWDPSFFPIVWTIVDRHDPRESELWAQGRKVYSLFCYEISNFEPDDCPYCAGGSEALKPKENREIFFPGC